MVTKLKILQGADQIGGNIILLEGEKSRLILDFGIPLTELDGTPIDIKMGKTDDVFPKELSCLKDEKQDKKTVILISHAHPDHYGMLTQINKSIPIYATRITKELIEKASQVLYKNMFDDLNIIEYKEPIETEDFIAESIPVNHSIGGACAYKITDKSSGKTILYSGDLRAHGRADLNELIKYCTKADYLIMEGTTLSRSSKTAKTEAEVEKDMAEVFSEYKMSIVCCSPMNKDRFLSVYNAVKKAGKTLVIDPYSALILESYKEEDFPRYNSENIKVYCAYPQNKKVFKDPKNMRFGRNKISMEEIFKEPEKYVIKHNGTITNYIFEKFNIDELNVVYSYWEGYLEDDKTWGKYKDKLKLIHTSGHIYEPDLITLVEKLNSKKIIPVHTLSAGRFKELFGGKSGGKSGDKVIELHNNEGLDIR